MLTYLSNYRSTLNYFGLGGLKPKTQMEWKVRNITKPQLHVYLKSNLCSGFNKTGLQVNMKIT